MQTMGVNKKHHEFSVIDMNSGWETLPGYPEGIQQKILSGALDEINKRGSRTRLLRFAPGAFTTTQVVHEYWEEVYIVSGDFTIGGKLLPPNSYTCQPPGVYHGPFKSNGGCLLFEVHYFDPV
jgi:ChrR-like protein with cupin domain